jgi:hypothetical protein
LAAFIWVKCPIKSPAKISFREEASCARAEREFNPIKITKRKVLINILQENTKFIFME